MNKRFCIVALLAVALLGLVATPALAQTGSVSLLLEDGYGPVSSLEVGRSLSARVTGLAPGQTVSVIVRDPNDWPVVSTSALASGSGTVVVDPLWESTGIVGCDCVVSVQAYAFRRVEPALQTLVTEVFEVVVEDSTGTVLASANLPLVAPSSPIAFPADATGCPRFHLQDSESLYVLVVGGTAGAQTDVTVAPGNGPIVEVRSNQPEGPTFALGGSGFELILLWPGQLTNPGSYRMVVGGQGWPPLQNIGPASINTGVVVEDHSCPPTDDPPGEG